MDKLAATENANVPCSSRDFNDGTPLVCQAPNFGWCQLVVFRGLCLQDPLQDSVTSWAQHEGRVRQQNDNLLEGV